MIELLKGSNVILFFLIPIVINVFISDFKYKTIKSQSLIILTNHDYLSKAYMCFVCIVLPILYVVLGFNDEIFYLMAL